MPSASMTGPTRVSLPAQAAYELDSLEKALGNLAERLGHPVCISGDMCVAAFSDLLDDPVVTGAVPEAAAA